MAITEKVSTNSSMLLIALTESSKLTRAVENSQLRYINGFDIIALFSLIISPSSRETRVAYAAATALI